MAAKRWEDQISAPVAPPREWMEHELAFADAWSKFCASQGPAEVAKIIDASELTSVELSRAYAVAASCATWLGTSCGAGLIRQAMRLQRANRFISPGSAYVCAWALQDQDGEFLPAICARGWEHGRPVAGFLSLQDYRTATAFFRWIGTPTGFEWLARADTGIDWRAEQAAT